MTRTHLTLPLSTKVNKSQLQSEEVIFESEVKCDQKFNHANVQKTCSTKSENDITHAIQWKLHERMNKKQI